MRIMVISTVKYNPNGIASVIRNLYANTVFAGDRITFVFPSGSDEQMYHEYIQLGHEVLLAQDRNTNPFRYMAFLTKEMRRRNIQLVHIHGNSGTCVVELLAAVMSGVKHRVMHGHSMTCNSMSLHKTLQPLLNMLTTVRYACSSEAGRFLFGERKCTVISNAIDTEKYRFDPRLRDIYRDQYGIAGKTVLGHVGTFTKLKNQIFLLDILSELKKRRINAVLLLIGDGPERKNVQEKAVELGLSDSVIFAGAKSNATEMLSMLDYFVFPSLSEGFGIAPLEAQANGLPVLAAKDRMPENVKINDNFKFVPLEKGPAHWCAELMLLPSGRCEAAVENVQKAGFDRMGEVLRMRQQFLSLMKE